MTSPNADTREFIRGHEAGVKAVRRLNRWDIAIFATAGLLCGFGAAMLSLPHWIEQQNEANNREHWQSRVATERAADRICKVAERLER